MYEEILKYAVEYGPLLFVVLFIIDRAFKYLSNKQSFTQKITEDSLSGGYAEEESSISTEVEKIKTSLAHQSDQMGRIEKQTTNHLSDITKDINCLRKRREKIMEKLGKIQGSIEQLSNKINK